LDFSGYFSGATLALGVKTGAGGLGLIGFVFPEPEGVLGFHNPLLKQSLCSFEHPANWVCFGFVFLDCESVVFSVILCYK